MDPQWRGALLPFFTIECAVAVHSRPTLTLKIVALVSTEIAEARYALMEKGAGTAVGALSLSSVACFFINHPGIWFVAGSLVAGVAFYLCWRAALAQSVGFAATAAMAGVLVALLSVATEIARPLPELLATGMSLLGLSLYASIFVAKLSRTRRAA